MIFNQQEEELQDEVGDKTNLSSEDEATVIHDEDARHITNLALVDVRLAIHDITITQNLVLSSDRWPYFDWCW